jgi:putative heme iron utilization protein
MAESKEGPGKHALPVGAATEAPPEPSFAERARTLTFRARLGLLSTHSRHVEGFPFGSLAPYGQDRAGSPTLLVSTMAMHTQNLLADPRASLLVAEPDWREDPLAGVRVTLVGRVARLTGDEVGPVREDYLARHENARHWVDFDDFSFYRLSVERLYYVGGFGAMGWVDAAAYAAAEPDPLAESAAGILEHMNADHADALVLYCRAFVGIEADEATMLSVDRLGFRVRARSGERLQGVRLNFPREARTPQQAREVLVEMVRTARAAL